MIAASRAGLMLVGGMASPTRGRRSGAEAAARLRHDLGKYIRFSAPETPEPSIEALRERLRADVLSTRRSASDTSAAADVFEEWRREEEANLPASGPLSTYVAKIGRAIEEIRALAARLDTLGRPELEKLDRLTRAVADDCRDFASAAKDAERGQL